jgi:hypothetical protein
MTQHNPQPYYLLVLDVVAPYYAGGPSNYGINMHEWYVALLRDWEK